MDPALWILQVFQLNCWFVIPAFFVIPTIDVIPTLFFVIPALRWATWQVAGIRKGQ